MHDISYWGMVPALSSNADTRNKFTARATLFAGIGGLAASVLIPMLTNGEHAIGGNAITAYGVIALVIAILAPAFLAITVFGVKEERNASEEPVPPVSFKKIWSTITGNDQLLWIALILLIQQIGNGIVLSGVGMNYIYMEFGYEGGFFSLFQIVGMAVTGFLMIFYPMISRKLQRKRFMDVMMLVGAFGYVIMLICCLLPKGLAYPLGYDLKFLLVTIGYMFANFGQYGFYLIMMISVMNTVEYNELRRGTRDEGIITSLRPFITKLASALNVAIAYLAYILFNTLKYTNGISDLETQCNEQLITEASKNEQIAVLLKDVTSSQSGGLLLVMTVLPFVLMFISYLLYKKHYTLDEPEYERICAELESRKQAENA
jgi:melibiose permease/lactose/raffinose/galactose permease